MAYDIVNLPPSRRSRLNKAASTVFNPLSAQQTAPTPTPTYGQQISTFMGSPEMAAPQFMAGTPNAQSTGAFGFSNAGQGGFGNLTVPSGGSASFQGQTVDYGNDPILKEIEAAVQAQFQEAQANAIGSEKQSLIKYGSGSLVKSVLGDQADQETINAAENNPFSTKAELGRWNTRALGGINSATNRNNLFFSSTRLRDRAMQEEDLNRKTANTANQLQDVLTGIAQNLLGVRRSGESQILGARSDAYNRAMQMAMYLAQLAAASSGGGGGGPTATPYSGGSPSGGISGINYGDNPPAGAGGVVTPWWQQIGAPPPYSEPTWWQGQGWG